MNRTYTGPSTNGPTGWRHQFRRSVGVAVLAIGLISVAACTTNSATNAAGTNPPTRTGSTSTANSTSSSPPTAPSSTTAARPRAR